MAKVGIRPRVQSRAILFSYCAVLTCVLTWFACGVYGLGPLDDHYMMSTLFRGKPFGFYVMPNLGRFFPLTAQEYVVLAKLFHPSAKLFYSFNAIKICVCGLLLILSLALTKLDAIGTAVLWSSVLVSVGVADTLYRLSAGEWNLLILMLWVIWAALFLSDAERGSTLQRRWIAISAVSVFTAALFLKELTFVFGLAFGAAEFSRRWRVRERIPRFIVGIGFVSVLYIVGYAIWRSLTQSGSYAALHSIAFNDLVALFATSDPFILFIALPVTVFRWSRIVTARNMGTIYDSFLLSAMAYAAAIFALDIYAPYYLLPTYAFAVIGVAGFLGLQSTRAIRGLVVFVSALLLIDCLPIFLADVEAQKAIANNHDQFVRELAAWLKANPPASAAPRYLVLAGTSAGNDIEIILSLGEFLAAYGVPPNVVAIVGSQPSDNRRISAIFGTTSAAGYRPRAGDVVIYNPYESTPERPPFSAPSRQPLFISSVQWALPSMLAWQWIALCMRSEICATSAARAERYVGYSAFLVKRDAASGVSLAPLASPAYLLSSFAYPQHVARGAANEVTVGVENTGKQTWAATGRIEAGPYVNMAYRWFDEQGIPIVYGDRTALPESILPGDHVQVKLTIRAPEKAGRYRLVIGPLQEGVQWFNGNQGRWIYVE